MNKTMISIVIPIYNERESLPELFNALRISLKKTDSSAEYVIVDDGSNDGSLDTLLSIKKQCKDPFHIIKFRRNSGKSAALAAGFELAKGDYIVTLDADLQDDPMEIPKMIQLLENGYGLVVGWRVNRSDPKRKIQSSHIFNSVVAKISGLPLHDTNCGLKALKKEAAKEIQLHGELHRFIPFLVTNKGFKVTEIPVTHHPRKYGHSKFGTSRIFRAFFDLITTIFITSFENNPLHIFGPTGLVFIIIGILCLMYLSILHFIGQSIIRRPLLQLSILFILFGVQIFSTGLIGELIINTKNKKDPLSSSEVID